MAISGDNVRDLTANGTVLADNTDDLENQENIRNNIFSKIDFLNSVLSKVFLRVSLSFILSVSQSHTKQNMFVLISVCLMLYLVI